MVPAGRKCVERPLCSAPERWPGGQPVLQNKAGWILISSWRQVIFRFASGEFAGRFIASETA